MKRILIVVFATLIVAFTLRTVHKTNVNNQRIQLKTIQLESTQVELDKLEEDYKQLELDKTKTEQQKQQEIEQLKQREKELEAQLQARQAEKARLAKVQATQKVYAATAPVSGSCADWVRQAGITEVDAALKLIARESGCRVNARNASSGAYGIPQALPGSKMATFGADWATNPITQLKWMNSYCISRYGSWANALAHSYSHNWY